jgi:peptidoglycan/LPS O-acetylase OafA/YrhL
MGGSSQWRVLFRASAVLAVIAGLLLFAGATRTQDYFSWTIAPAQTAAFLGAAYWAAAVLFSWASAQRGWESLRIAFFPELVVALLLLIATFASVEKFHSNLFGYFWVVVYAIATPTLIYLLAMREPQGGGPEPREPMPAWLRLALIAQGAAFAVYGVGLFIAPSSFDSAWPWALTPLTARAIASFLLGFAVAAGIAAFGNCLRRFRGAALTYAVLGALELLAAALHSSDFKDGAALPLYVAFFASVLAVGIAGSLPNIAAQPSKSRSAASLS